MFKNAKTYNQEGSLVYKDADRMEKYSRQKLAKIESKLGVHIEGTNAEKSDNTANDESGANGNINIDATSAVKAEEESSKVAE